MKFTIQVQRLTTLACLVLALGCATREASPDFNARSGLPIVQGLTNETATQFAIVSPDAMKLKFSYEVVAAGIVPGAALIDAAAMPLTSTVRTSVGSKITVFHVKVDDLRIGETYRLNVRDQSDQIVDQRFFRALDTSPRPARVAAASCLYDLFVVESRPMWRAVIDSKPDLLLLIGDNVYAEVSNGRFPSPLDEKALWIRYSETFFALDFYKSKTLVPTLVTWDDHDYGMKDGNRENPFKAESKKVLESFFAQDADPAFQQHAKGPGVSSMFDAFGYRFMLLDDRSFRSPKSPNAKSADADSGQTHFGVEQEKWITTNVRQSPYPVWLISGDQWFGAYHKFESYEGRHPESLKTFLQAISRTPRPVFFLSGDRHLSEVSKIEKDLLGYETYEFTSSSLHSRAHPSNWATIPNPRHVMGVELKHNFIMFELTPPVTSKPVRLRGSSIGAESKTYYTFDVRVSPVESRRTRAR